MSFISIWTLWRFLWSFNCARLRVSFSVAKKRRRWQKHTTVSRHLFISVNIA